MKKIKIQCGDHYVELTREEIRCVYQYQDSEYLKEDVVSRLEGFENETNEETTKAQQNIEEMADRAREYLDDCDGYWDCYWAVISDAIYDVIKE